MANKHQLIPVPFMGDTLEIIDHQGEPFVAVKRIVQNLGLDWKNQHEKLTRNTKRWGVVQIRIPSAGGPQDSLCMPLLKLAGFMQTIDAGRVPKGKREKIELYQEQGDKALWDFWTKGHAVHPQAAALVAPPRKMVELPDDSCIIKKDALLDLQQTKIAYLEGRGRNDFTEEEKEYMKDARAKGESNGEIAETLGRPKGSVSGWFHNNPCPKGVKK